MTNKIYAKKRELQLKYFVPLLLYYIITIILSHVQHRNRAVARTYGKVKNVRLPIL